jgi:gamma-glutamyl hydrolase
LLFIDSHRLLIPGGANFYNTSGYGLAGEILYDLAIDLNKRGDFFPIWGTCLGFELLIYLMAGKDDPRIVCDAWDKADPLDFEPGLLLPRADSSKKKGTGSLPLFCICK